jgi:hypothetical protein
MPGSGLELVRNAVIGSALELCLFAPEGRTESDCGTCFGFAAGSSWSSDEQAEFLVFDRGFMVGQSVEFTPWSGLGLGAELSFARLGLGSQGDGHLNVGHVGWFLRPRLGHDRAVLFVTAGVGAYAWKYDARYTFYGNGTTFGPYTLDDGGPGPGASWGGGLSFNPRPGLRVTAEARSHVIVTMGEPVQYGGFSLGVAFGRSR